MARNQTGFVTLPIMGWVAIAAGAAIIALSVALKLQSARLDAKDAELRACATRYAETLKSVIKSNAAVDKLAEDSAKRARIAAAALAKAKQGEGSLNTEIARLKGLNVQALDCSGAVAAAKAGMKP